MRLGTCVLAASAIAASGCAANESETPTATVVAPGDAVRMELAAGVTGVAVAPPAETDQVPVFELEGFDVEAIDAAVDPDTQTLAWIDAHGTLWIAPVDRAPGDARRIAEHAILGLAAAGGRVAYAVRVDGPDTAAFAYDLRAQRTIALSDAPGPDEVLGFSPDGSEVLLLSGRTGLASLFAASVAEPTARQLTNVGLAPGRGLDPAQVTPAPENLRAVQWTDGGIRYATAGQIVEVRR